MARQQIVLRVDGQIKRDAKKAAAAQGISLNEYCERRIAGKRTGGGKVATKK